MESSGARFSACPANYEGKCASAVQEKAVVDIESALVPTSSTGIGSAPNVDLDNRYMRPTEEQRAMLRRVPGRFPKISLIICIAESAERASYYGVRTAFNNFMQFPLPEGGNGAGAVAKSKPNDHAGALGMGLQFASALGLLCTFFTYIIPFLGAWIADVKCGRFKTIMIGVIIGGVAHVVMVGGAAPSVLQAGKGLAPFLFSFLLLAIGAGVLKPNVAPLIIDQYTHQREYVRSLPSGETVIVDPQATIQRISMVFYACVNLGAFFALPSTYLAKYVGFWSAFLLPGAIYLLLPALLCSISSRTVRKPPVGSELRDFARIIITALEKNHFRFWAPRFWDAAKPTVLAAQGIEVPWSEKLVRDVARTSVACQIFFFFPLYQMNLMGVGASSTNQGAAMTTNGAPNDLMSTFNPLLIVFFTPIMSYNVYPLLRQSRIQFGIIRRLTFGFLLATCAAASGAVVQWRVYSTSPCGWQASTCKEGVSPISIWYQLGNVMLSALSEVFAQATAIELAYSRAPSNMKSLVTAVFSFMSALQAVISIALVPLIRDPLLVWVWGAPGFALFLQTCFFYWRYRSVDDDAFLTYEDGDENQPTTAALENVKEVGIDAVAGK